MMLAHDARIRGLRSGHRVIGPRLGSCESERGPGGGQWGNSCDRVRAGPGRSGGRHARLRLHATRRYRGAPGIPGAVAEAARQGPRHPPGRSRHAIAEPFCRVGGVADRILDPVTTLPVASFNGLQITRNARPTRLGVSAFQSAISITARSSYSVKVLDIGRSQEGSKDSCVVVPSSLFIMIDRTGPCNEALRGRFVQFARDVAGSDEPPN